MADLGAVEVARPARRARASLSADLILDTALDLIDGGGESALTFRQLGRQLGADPTAVYRYFRSKDDLLLAMADRIFEQTLPTVPMQPDWRATLRAMALAAYEALLRHPRLAVLVAARTTQGPGEARAIERILAALDDAGLPPVEAVEVWRALGDTVLAWAGLTAAFIAMPTDLRAKDEAAWTQTYPALPPGDFPHLTAAGPYLAAADQSDMFPVVVELLLDGVARRIAAPTPRRPS